MKRIIPPVIMVAMLSLAVLPAWAGEKPMPGAPAVAEVDKPEVIAAAKFAVQAREKQETAPAKLELVKILEAREQVVAGMNYQLKLKVKLNGQEKTADAVVWWQAWRKPDPYQLTAWTWK